MNNVIPGLEERDWPTCPHCQLADHKVDEEMVTHGTEEGMTCRGCGKDYNIRVNVTVSYCTLEAEDHREEEELGA